MSIFQKSIVKKHLSSENQEVLKTKWNLFTSYFHNATIQENIHNSKEEQFQEGFLRELFVKVLGYTLNPEPNFNLTTEYKNIKDSKKADGAIIINNIVTAVIELKGTGTTDLGKVESQAFNYKNNQHQCVYVITSNFEKLRFYIDNAIEHIEFNLFKLTEEEFQLLYLCLAFKNIENNVPKNIKDESVSQEDVITKKLYNDYSLFKRELHHNLVALNPGNDPLELFQKSQKLLDRFLFIFFAEDRGLLPTNLIFRINKEWQQLREMRIDVSLYDRYKIYFSDLNVGAKVSLPAFSQTASNKKDEFQIYAYNGGLFKEDDELNTLKIDDALLFKHTEKLSNYDFASEVDVNILGHIFENSLNELDEIKAQLEGQEIDKTKTKRKKDGVFYTPKYITKYIVDNTVGKLCNDKKVEFKIIEEEYITDKKRNKTTIQNLATKLTDYRNWLLQITICDPACGSGAFLNQALDFLINEHKYIDELQAKLFGDALVMSDVEQSILENNIFGVDINEESVEIAKLSLWLRTAQPNRKLNDLNSNIKCGNSLVDDITVAGDKAFNWNNSFKEVFEKGGFDVVIGNPPYVRAENIDKKQREYFISKHSKYSKTFGRFDLYIVFNELGMQILKPNGILSYIFPSSFFNQNYSSLQRDWLLNEVNLTEIVDLSNIDVFKGVAVETAIIIVKNEPKSDFLFSYKPSNETEFIQNKKEIIKKEIFNNLPNKTFRADLDEITISLILKIRETSNIVDDFCYTVIGAVPHNSTTGASKDRLISLNCDKPSCKKYLEGKNVNRYSINWDKRYIDYIPEEMHRPKFPELFENEKVLVRNISTTEGILATYDNDFYYVNDTMSVLILWEKLINVNQKGVKATEEQINHSKYVDLKYLIALINSRLINYYYKKVLSSNLHVYPEAIRNLPIRTCNKETQRTYILNVDSIIELKKQLYNLSHKFQGMLLRKFNLIEVPKKIEDFYLYSYSDLIKELAKKKIKLSLSDESEWEEYFNTESKKALELKSKIDATDKEIDQMVYKLYNLTLEEIAIIEKN